MIKVSKGSIKVEACQELVCPFFHAGHMGSTRCLAFENEQGRYRDITVAEEGKKPPSWCPLRTAPVKVQIR